MPGTRQILDPRLVNMDDPLVWSLTSTRCTPQYEPKQGEEPVKHKTTALRRISAASVAALLALGLTASPASAASGTHNCLFPANQQQGVVTATTRGAWRMRAPGSTFTATGTGPATNETRTERANRLLGGAWYVRADVIVGNPITACVLNAV